MAYRYFRASLCNPDWQEKESGLAKHLRGHGNTYFRKLMFALRGKRCQLASCARNLPASKLHLHHVKKIRLFRELRFEPSNVVVVCYRCHPKVEELGEGIFKLLSSDPGTIDSALIPQKVKDPLSYILNLKESDKSLDALTHTFCGATDPKPAGAGGPQRGVEEWQLSLLQ